MTSILQKTILTLIVSAFSILSNPVFSQGNEPILSSTVLLNGNVSVRVDIIGIVKTCHDWGFHYGYVVRIRSNSTTNSPYNITYNLYIHSSSNSGHAYGGAYTLSNTSQDNIQTIFNNGFEVQCNGMTAAQCHNRCNNFTVFDGNPTSFTIDYWGSSGGSNNGSFVTPLSTHLVDFKVYSNNKSNIVDWEVEKNSEKNFDYFIVAQSNDGFNWNDIEYVQKSSTSKYQVFDRMNGNENYYQLKGVNFEGKQEMLDIGYINNDKSNLTFQLYDMIGNEVDQLQKGITIKKYSNGEVEKIYQ